VRTAAGGSLDPREKVNPKKVARSGFQPAERIRLIRAVGSTTAPNGDDPVRLSVAEKTAAADEKRVEKEPAELVDIGIESGSVILHMR
jgi:hypothetical protein